MKKILISINDNSLIFSYNRQHDEELNTLMNTNVISNNELIFSDEYIINNSKIVGLFLKELISEKKINHIIITKLSILSILKKLNM